jgi:hypothetical protein
MMSDISAGTITGGPKEDCWNEIVGLVRSKNVVPEGMTDADIKTIVREVYERWWFYPAFGAFTGVAHHRIGDRQADDWFLAKIIEAIKRMPECIPAGEGREEAAENEIRAVRARFDSISESHRDGYLERARRILRPLFHNNHDAVFFTALELMVHDETMKGVKA